MSDEGSLLASEVLVLVASQYIAQQSVDAEQQFVFSYTITISNNSVKTVQLLNRYWLITDANGDTSEVSGEGVIGQQPFIKAGESFTYSSGCLLKSPLGYMQGHYQMQVSSGEIVNIDIPVFRLVKPNVLN
ncbi:Co2+/Mg2+ efflux protein ApaG [Colwellia sp. M166]|uniref:Co2+/Mg2+ efflux protein ApaG n=1 Tax=Colwellia sp. M166 TaxID=2583805 RepID=UPI00211E7C18|nr:Co2+/Mg2+ efflux protein ApaG [Colwellia sp. M166]UUO24434.1 Co2+/Mg2+ efflux protein ApaG [Colwellia sp. M166]|tara:strand:- start:4671 stop:5063 length:393 start_codon:yes stop_codon:yes gene_type:complete